MDRRTARLRRDYQYRKSLEAKEAKEFEKKKRQKEALEEGKPLPKDLRKKAGEQKESADIDGNFEQRTHIDDEYQNVGYYDPKIQQTTSRDSSSRQQQFVKELSICLPNCQRVNRGNTKIEEQVELCKSNSFSDLIQVNEHNGDPDGLIVSHFPYGPTAYFTLKNCVLRHDLDIDIGTMPEANPHLIFDNFTTNIGIRTKTILQSLFCVPKSTTKRIVSFINKGDTIIFRHHIYKWIKVNNGDNSSNSNNTADDSKQDNISDRQDSEKSSIHGKNFTMQLAEIGPRFEMKLYHIKLATVDISSAETEWVHRPYMNSAKRRMVL